ncbi:MAG: DUF5615 family PIN-like protein [bacterium]
MKFLLDAKLPPRLAERLRVLGHDVIHTLDLSEGNRTSDREICRIADSEGRVVVTKDRDFVDPAILMGSPARLLLITTGNIGNDDLIELFRSRSTEIESSLRKSRFVEMSRSGLFLHE